MKFNGIVNHWVCLKDWFEFKLFDIIYDYKDEKYLYLEITVLNFEFVWYDEKDKNEGLI